MDTCLSGGDNFAARLARVGGIRDRNTAMFHTKNFQTKNFGSKFRNHCAKKLVGALGKSTSFV